MMRYNYCRPASVKEYPLCKIIKPVIGNIQKTNYFEKMTSLFRLNRIVVQALTKDADNVEYDLILYSTPPITIAGLIKSIRKKCSAATTVLMLKDIWPQEMVDLAIIKKNGILESYFRKQEKDLYSLSDWIGCTSQANVDYLLSHNDYLNSEKVILIHNSVDPIPLSADQRARQHIREKYHLPSDVRVFFYGGNLGKAQGIDYLLGCLQYVLNRKECFFVICGNGTEYYKLERFFEEQRPDNMLLLPYMSKSDYNDLLDVADVAMVFLNSSFTVPNDPSRYYTYLEHAKPIFACTDKATNIGNEISQEKLGWWCESEDVNDFAQIVETILQTNKEELVTMGLRARAVLEREYMVIDDYYRIIKCVER